MVLAVEQDAGRTATIWLDGEPLAGGSTLAVGRHLLQWQVPGEGLGTRLLDVREGDSLTVMGRGDVLAAAIAGHGSAAARQRASEALRALATAVDRPEVYLAELGEVDLLHRFDVAEGRWELSDRGTVALRQRKRRSTEGGIVALTAGAATTAVGLMVGVTGSQQAQGELDGAGNIESDREFDDASRRYEEGRSQAYLGLTIGAVGCAVMVTGIPLLISGRRDDSPASESTVRVRPVVTPWGFGLSGTF